MLKEVWMQVGLEKVDSHEGVSVKALLDSSATGMFADKKFVEKNGFKLEKLDRPVRIRNVDGTGNNYPLLLITDLVDTMGNKRVFTKMDL